MPCTVELLSVGNELLLGNTVNTNAAWLAAKVTSLGGMVTRTTTVRDDLQDIAKAIRETIQRRPDFVITTGGIGPTFDDMTIKAVAKAFHLRLALNRTALKMIREHYVRRFPDRKISLTRPRLKMALLPSGGTPLPNPVGTAPGVRLFVRKTQIFCLPGVPKEAKEIFRETVSKAIRSKAGDMVFVEKWIRVHGIMESSLAPIVDRVMAHWPGIYIKSHPRGVEGRGRPHIELHLSISASDSARAEQVLLGAITDTIRQLRDCKAIVTQTK
jgi:molybdenum cofactor synthesis domain-containing protein